MPGLFARYQSPLVPNVLASPSPAPRVAPQRNVLAQQQAGGGMFPGMVTQGNIDLTKRPVIKNQDGSISTVLSFSTEIDGKEVVLPMAVGGRIVSQREAIDHYFRTGEHLGMFNKGDYKGAEEFAQQLHNSQADYYRQGR